MQDESPTYTDEEQAEIDRAIEEKVMDDLYDINSDNMCDVLPMVYGEWHSLVEAYRCGDRCDLELECLMASLKEKLRECHG